MSLDIQVFKGKRDGVKKSKNQEKYSLPSNGLLYVASPTGSGKTNLICNLLQPRMLGNVYDKIYIFTLSPCTMLLEHCDNIEEENIIIGDKYGEILTEIVQKQENYIDEHEFKKAPHILIICDDVISSKPFMKNPTLSKLAFMGTHMKFSTWIISQDYHSLPKAIRMNVHGVIIIHGVKEKEIESFIDEHASAFLSRNQMRQLIKHAIEEPYSFLFYNCTNPNKKEAYRKNFDKVLKIQ